VKKSYRIFEVFISSHVRRQAMDSVLGAGGMTDVALMNLLTRKKKLPKSSLSTDIALSQETPQNQAVRNTVSSSGSGRTESLSASGDSSPTILTRNVHGNRGLNAYRLIAEGTLKHGESDGTGQTGSSYAAGGESMASMTGGISMRA